jgi:hypothetical protein
MIARHRSSLRFSSKRLTILVQKLGHNVLRASLFARSTAWFASLLFSTSVALVPHEIGACNIVMIFTRKKWLHIITLDSILLATLARAQWESNDHLLRTYSLFVRFRSSCVVSLFLDELTNQVIPARRRTGIVTANGTGEIMAVSKRYREAEFEEWHCLPRRHRGNARTDQQRVGPTCSSIFRRRRYESFITTSNLAIVTDPFPRLPIWTSSGAFAK